MNSVEVSCMNYIDKITNDYKHIFLIEEDHINRSSVGVVVKLFACGARGLGFDSRSHRYDIRDWLSPASKSRYG